MYQFLGEYELKVDTKNRIALPAALRKEFNDMNHFVISRALDKCLNFYPIDAWREVEAELDKLNPFVKKERDFARFVRGGATEIILDGQGRFILPKRLMMYASITADMILLGNGNLFEMWDLETYEEMLSINPEEFSLLAEEVMTKEFEEDKPVIDPSIVVPLARS